MEPSIWKSRKFWLMLADVVISIILFYSDKYLPGAIADVKFLIGVLQPVVVSLIVGYTVQNTEAMRSLGAPEG